jgi:hypothetical protein
MSEFNDFLKSNIDLWPWPCENCHLAFSLTAISNESLDWVCEMWYEIRLQMCLQIMKMAVFWVVAFVVRYKFTNVSEVLAASIIGAMSKSRTWNRFEV